MAELLNQHHLAQILGAARLRRFIRAGWLTPAQRPRCNGDVGGGGAPVTSKTQQMLLNKLGP
jgi:hypothetical protein